jgi:hypothetical protein
MKWQGALKILMSRPEPALRIFEPLQDKVARIRFRLGYEVQ